MPTPEPASKVEPWVLDIAQEMVRVVNHANHKGVLTFVWAGKTLVRVEWPNGEGIVVTFPDPVKP